MTQQSFNTARLTVIRPRFRPQTWAARIFGCNREDCRMIQGRKVPPVMNQGISYAKRCRSDVPCAMHPVRIGGSGRWRPNRDMNVGAMGMID